MMDILSSITIGFCIPDIIFVFILYSQCKQTQFRNTQDMKKNFQKRLSTAVILWWCASSY